MGGGAAPGLVTGSTPGTATVTVGIVGIADPVGIIWPGCVGAAGGSLAASP